MLKQLGTSRRVEVGQSSALLNRPRWAWPISLFWSTENQLLSSPGLSSADKAHQCWFYSSLSVSASHSALTLFLCSGTTSNEESFQDDCVADLSVLFCFILFFSFPKVLWLRYCLFDMDVLENVFYRSYWNGHLFYLCMSKDIQIMHLPASHGFPAARNEAGFWLRKGQSFNALQQPDAIRPKVYISSLQGRSSGLEESFLFFLYPKSYVGKGSNAETKEFVESGSALVLEGFHV